MTELVQSVRLNYDGSGVVGQVKATKAAIDEVSDAARAVGPASAGIAKVGDAGQAAAGGVASATAAVRELVGASTGAGSVARDIASIGGSASGAVAGIAELGARQSQLSAANENVAKSSGSASIANVVLQSVIRKTVDQFAAGASASTIFAEHIESAVEILELYSAGAARTRTASAAAAGGLAVAGEAAVEGGAKVGLLSGALGGVAEFLSGPWGIALTVGVAALSPLVGKLFETGDASSAASKALDEFIGKEQQVAQYADRATGKLNEQLAAQAKLAGATFDTSLAASNKSTVQDINAAISAARSFVADNRSRSGPIGASLDVSRALIAANGNSTDLANSINAIAKSEPANAALQKLAQTVNDYASQALAANKNTHQLLGAQQDLKTLQSGGILLTPEIISQQVEQATATDRLSKAQAALHEVNAKIVADNAQLVGSARQAALAQDKIALLAAKREVDAAQDAKKRQPAARKAPDTSGLVNSVLGDIRSFTAEFTDVPTFVEKARTAIAKLDHDIAELAKKKPPNFQSLIDQAEAAKGVIEANIDKPYADFIKQQQQAFQVSRLLAQGHVDEANALKAVFQLQQQMVPLTDEQKAGVLATVQALRGEQEAQERLNASRQRDLQALDQVRSAIEGVFTGGIASINKLPGELLASFKQLAGGQLFDKLFDGAFTQLKDQASGVTPVKDASAKMAAALDTLRTPIVDLVPNVTDASRPLIDLATNAGGAANALAGLMGGGGTASIPSLVAGTSASQIRSLSGDTQGLINDNPDLFPGEDLNEIIVTATKPIKQAGADFLSATALFNKTGASFGAGLDKLIDPNGGFFAKLGSHLGDALKGAAIGSTAGSLFSSVTGTKGSNLGGSIGGAVGNIAGQALGGPIGGVIGSVLGGIAGSVLGGLFKTVKKGTATIGVVDGAAAVTGTSGNSKSRISTAKSEAGGVIDSLGQVVDALDGTLGNFAVSIGQRGKKFTVDTSGRGRTKGSTVTKYGTAEEAEAAALSDAIADGAVGGISAAMKKALSSSSDVSKGVAEALKVRDVQDVLTGLGTDLLSSFRSVEQQAKDRLRIAQTYGFDVTAITKYNAQQQTDLVASFFKQSVGSLQDLLTSLASGDLSEGDATTKRKSLLAQITSTRADANAGKDGAADTLSALLGNLVQTDREMFGTAGPQYAADRALAQTAAEQAIKAENDRLKAAEAAVGTTNQSLATVASLADENNSQNAQMISKLDAIVAALGPNVKVPILSAASAKALSR